MNFGVWLGKVKIKINTASDIKKSHYGTSLYCKNPAWSCSKNCKMWSAIDLYFGYIGHICLSILLKVLCTWTKNWFLRRQIFKGGNYSRAETTRWNTVYLKIFCTKLGKSGHSGCSRLSHLAWNYLCELKFSAKNCQFF